MHKLTITKLTPYLISAASIIFAGQFLYHTVQSSFSAPNIMWIIFTVSISILTFIGLRYEFNFSKAIKLNSDPLRVKKLTKSFIIIVLNTMVTFLLASSFDVSTTFTASLVCVLSTYIFPSNQPEAYSGSVGGMIGSYLCSHWSTALLIGIVSGITFILFFPYFNGIGGRGGSIPYVASMFSVRLLLLLTPTQGTPIDNDYIAPSLITIVLIAFITYLLHKYEILTIVRAAMIIVLIGAILIPETHSTILTALFAGTVVGMSVEDRLDGPIHLAIVAVICFLLFVPSFHILEGIGGKLGILSFIAYHASIGLKIIVTQMSLRFLPNKI